MLRDVADNFLNHGLTRLVILNGHSGNAPLIDQVAREIRQDTGLVVPSVNLWRLQTPAVWQEAYGVRATRLRTRRGTGRLRLPPSVPRTGAAGGPGGGRSHEGQLHGLPDRRLRRRALRGRGDRHALDVTDLTDNGIAGGDPFLASAAAGARVTQHIVDTVAAFVTAFRDAAGA
ncbi:MAG: creatininase family protein [Acetobacteraceae bacterium]